MFSVLIRGKEVWKHENNSLKEDLWNNESHRMVHLSSRETAWLTRLWCFEHAVCAVPLCVSTGEKAGRGEQAQRSRLMAASGVHVCLRSCPSGAPKGGEPEPELHCSGARRQDRLGLRPGKHEVTLGDI